MDAAARPSLEEEDLAVERASFEATFRAVRRSTGIGALLLGAGVDRTIVIVYCAINFVFRAVAVTAAHLGISKTERRARQQAMRILVLALVPVGLMGGGAALLTGQTAAEMTAHWFGLFVCAAAMVAANVMIGHGRTRPFLSLALPLLVTSVLSCLQLSGTVGYVFALGSIGVGIMFIAGNREAGEVFRDAQRYQFQNRELVVDLEAANKKLQRMACIDGLTGIDNRVGLDARLAEHGQRTRPVAVSFVDLDGFKEINDTYGHEAGDRALKAVAERLVGSLGANDIVARLGGDEFLVLMTLDSARDVESAAERIRQCFTEPVDVGPTTLPVRASLGIVVAEVDDDLQAAVTRADTAMYSDKLGRRGHRVEQSRTSGDCSGAPRDKS